MTEERETHREVVLVARAVPSAAPDPMTVLLGAVSGSLGASVAAVTAAASTMASVTERAVGSTVGSALDRIVPAIADAVIRRLDLTSLVLERVDLNRVITGALDSIDLTSVVIDRVDVDAIIAEADFDAIIDRVPVVPLANYVIEEIDLPQIIRESTGGIATDAVNAIRVQGVGADQLVSRLADRILLRRRQRRVDAPGDPESIVSPTREDFASEPRSETVVDTDA